MAKITLKTAFQRKLRLQQKKRGGEEDVMCQLIFVLIEQYKKTN